MKKNEKLDDSKKYDISTTQLKEELSFIFPSRLHIEPTNLCNLKCIMCPRLKGGRKMGYINMNLFKKIVDECVDHVKLTGKKLTALDLQKDGEPLMHPQINELVKYAKDSCAFKFVRINTNGTLLNETMSRKLIEAGLDSLKISLDGITKKTYEKIRIGAKYEQVLANIDTFIKIRKEMKKKTPDLRIQIIAMEENKKQLVTFKKKWEKIADEVKIQHLLSWHGEYDVGVSALKRFPCVLLWQHAVINWDGIVTICPIDYNNSGIIGNLNKNSLNEIWNSARLQEFRINHLEGKYNLEPCTNCVDWHSIEPARTLWTKKMIQKFKNLTEKKLRQK